MTHLPDISEYGFTDYPELSDTKHIAAKDPDLVDLQRLAFLIRTDRFPVPFESETPAIDLYKDEDEE